VPLWCTRRKARFRAVFSDRRCKCGGGTLSPSPFARASPSRRAANFYRHARPIIDERRPPLDDREQEPQSAPRPVHLGLEIHGDAAHYAVQFVEIDLRAVERRLELFLPVRRDGNHHAPVVGFDHVRPPPD